MDIKKEQNSFKKTMLDQHGEYDEEHFELDSYGNFSWIGTDDHFEIWMLCAKAKQAEIDELKGKLAKAQAVPEGFVLVKKEHLSETVEKIELMFEEDSLLALGELLPIQQGISAMIEAQEQSK